MAVTVVAVENPRLVAAVESVPGVTVVTAPDVTALDALIADGLRADAMYAFFSADAILERAERLGVRWVHIAGTGIDAVPDGLLDGRTVTCGRGISGVPIAEFVLASMLAFEKRFPETWIHAPAPNWGSARFGELAGKTLGLVGLGGIGTEVARRALAFDMTVLAVRRRAASSPVDRVELAGDLGEVLARADHLVLAAPATASTTRLIATDALATVKPGVHLVNVSRGALVDQDALRVALDDGRVALASLDTVDPEPLPPGHWLYTHPRVHLSAHVSHSSPEARRRMVEAFTENLARFVAGDPLVGVVEPDEGY